MRVHQSILNDCLRAMQYNIESPVYHGGSIRAVGTGYHKSLETFYRERMVDPDTTPHSLGFWGIDGLVKIGQDEFDRVASGAPSHSSEHSRQAGNFKWNAKVPDTDTAHAMIDKMVRAYFDGGHYWPAEWTVLGVEQSFELPWYGQHTRGGSADLVLQGPDGTIIIDDQKTAGRAWVKGKESARKSAQGPWYLWAMMDLFPGAPDYRVTFSIMQYNGTFERREATPTPEQMNAQALRLAETVNLYTVLKANGMDLPANPSSTLCSPEYCDHWSICPWGEAIDTPVQLRAA